LLWCSQESADFETLFSSTLDGFPLRFLVHLRRAGKDSEVLAAWLAYDGMAIVRREIDDPIISPDHRKEGRKEKKEQTALGALSWVRMG
jgi:hypothetical protein